MRLKGVLLILLGLVIAMVAAVIQGRGSWQARTNALQAELLAAQADLAGQRFDTLTLDALPPPVARMFRAVLTPGQPMVATASLRHEGSFDMGRDEPNWRPFTSQQRVLTRRPGFVWDARIAMLPLLPVHVHDAYVSGRGVLRAKMLGLITVMDVEPTPQLAQGELMRWVAEAAWYPTALLPGPGVQWSAVDDSTARLTVVDGDIGVSLTVGFGADGRIATVRSEERYRDTPDGPVATPWVGHFWDYAEQDGMWIPRDGEVSWIYADGPRPYWRGHITSLEYSFGR